VDVVVPGGVVRVVAVVVVVVVVGFVVVVVVVVTGATGTLPGWAERLAVCTTAKTITTRTITPSTARALMAPVVWYHGKSPPSGCGGVRVLPLFGC
jgi:hypothetical protein